MSQDVESFQMHDREGVVRLAIVGSHGTGKTSLAEMLAEKLGLPLIKEQARVAASEMGITARQITPENFCAFQLKALEFQFVDELKNDTEGFVSDRSVFDYLIYLRRPSFDQFDIESPEYLETLQAYKNIVSQRENRYTHIVYLTPMFELEDDSFRHDTYSYQLDIDFQFNSWLMPYLYSSLHINTYAVESDALDERCQEVLDWIKGTSR